MSGTIPFLAFALRLAVLALLAVAATGPARAHGGDDHDRGPPPAGTGAATTAAAAAPAAARAPGAPAGSAPRRQPDGAVLLPKPSQRQLGLRTLPTTRDALARAVELPGLVAIDPAAAGRVQASSAGRVEPGPGGLPTIGQAVARGQVLAVVRPTISPVERSSQAAQLAELRASRELVARRVARLRDLADTVPRKEIEAAESELAALSGRIAALAGGLQAAERLEAPVSGVVASASVVAGQVVDAGAVLFEIVDPTRLRIEATGFDPALATTVAGASIEIEGRAVPLAFVGAGRVMREQAVPLVFRARDAALARLAVGQPVQVTVRTGTKVEGVPVPAAALVRTASDEPAVWIKTAPERFEPRRVRTQPLDAARVVVVDGLSGGERVVVDGAPLLNQVR